MDWLRNGFVCGVCEQLLAVGVGVSVKWSEEYGG